MTSSSLAQGFGSLATQQQAKSMSQQYLNSNAGGKPTVYSNDVTAIKDIASFMGNQANQTFNQRYDAQKRDAQYNQQMSASNQVSVDRTNFERQINNQKSLIAEKNSNQNVGGFIGGGSDFYDYNLGSSSVNRGLFNASKMADYSIRQGTEANAKAMLSRANAAGDVAIKRAEQDIVRQQGQNAVDLANTQAFVDDRTNWFNSYDQQQQANLNRGFQAEESAAERASRERGQSMDAQSKVYSSMFNSFSGGGNQNYQYWGGGV